MTVFQTVRQQILLILVVLLCSGCDFYPNGMTEYSDYIPLSDSVGILSRTNGQVPSLVLAQKFGVDLLVDERIIGSWYFQDSNYPNIVLSNDGIGSLTIPSLFTKSGNFQWISHNVIIITFLDGSYAAVKFEMITDDIAYVIIGLENMEQYVITIGQKQRNIQQLTKVESTSLINY